MAWVVMMGSSAASSLAASYSCSKSRSNSGLAADGPPAEAVEAAEAMVGWEKLFLPGAMAAYVLSLRRFETE